jgi:hypothetical protein
VFFVQKLGTKQLSEVMAATVITSCARDVIQHPIIAAGIANKTAAFSHWMYRQPYLANVEYFLTALKLLQEL